MFCAVPPPPSSFVPRNNHSRFSHHQINFTYTCYTYTGVTNTTCPDSACCCIPSLLPPPSLSPRNNHACSTIINLHQHTHTHRVTPTITINQQIMRVWSLHPMYLDRQGFLGLWVETLLCQKVSLLFSPLSLSLSFPLSLLHTHSLSHSHTHTHRSWQGAPKVRAFCGACIYT